MRPEKIHILEDGEEAAGRHVETGVVRDVQYAGPFTRHHVTLERGGELQVLTQNLDEGSVQVLETKGRTVRLAWRPEQESVIDESEGGSMRRRNRAAVWAALGLLVAALSVVAAGCGGGSDSASTEIEGLGSTLDEIRANAKDEGEVNLVIWAGYADKSWAAAFTKQTGCTVNTKDGASSDDMVDLMSTGAYDGVSASGDATLRLIANEDVAPVNFDLIPNYADVFEGLKDKSYNTVDGVGYGVPHGRGPNLMVWRTDTLPATNDTWAPIWPGTDYKGKLSIYDNQIFIADAALYLKATQPDLNITDPYELDEDQFNAAVDLLKQQRPNIGEYWDGVTYAKQVTTFKSGESAVGTTWPYQVNLMAAEKPPVPVDSTVPKEGTTGWSDTWMIAAKAARSELHVPLDGLHHLPGGEREGRGVLRRGTLQQERVCLDDRPESLRELPRRRRDVLGQRLLLEHPPGELRRRQG